MSGFLLRVIWCEDINDGHEVDLLLGGTWRGSSKEEEVAGGRAESSWIHNPSDRRSRLIPLILDLRKKMADGVIRSFRSSYLIWSSQLPMGMRVFIRFCPPHEPQNHASHIQDKQKGDERPSGEGPQGPEDRVADDDSLWEPGCRKRPKSAITEVVGQVPTGHLNNGPEVGRAGIASHLLSWLFMA